MTASTPRLEKFKDSVKENVFFGQRLNVELFAILTIYFVQGVLGLSRLAVSFFLKDDLGLSPAQVSALVGVAALPWVIKPVFGFLSDGFPIGGYRRRPYLILSGIVGAIAWILLATVVHTALAATIVLLFSSLSVAVSDVIADSLVVERVRGESLSEAGSLQSLTWGVSALGGIITAYLSGLLLQLFNPQTIFGITALFPLIVTAVAWSISEKPIKTQDKTAVSNIKTQIKDLWGAIRQKTIWLPILFIFFWQATPNSDSALFFFTTNKLGFEPEFLGRIRLVASVASLIGIAIYHRFLRSVPFRVILGWTTVLASALGMTTLLLVTHANRAIGIDDHWFSLGDSLILTIMGQVAFMPLLVLCARLCPKGVEATLFALLMSIWNLAGLLSHELGALLTHILGVTEHNFTHLGLLVVLTNLSSLLPLPFLRWLPAQEELTDAMDLD